MESKGGGGIFTPKLVRRGEGGNYGNAVRNSDILLTAIDEECDYVHEVLSSRKWENPFGIDFLNKNNLRAFRNLGDLR